MKIFIIRNEVVFFILNYYVSVGLMKHLGCELGRSACSRRSG